MGFSDRLFESIRYFERERARRKPKWRKGPERNAHIALKAAQVGLTFEDYECSEEFRNLRKEPFLNPALDPTDVSSWEYLADTVECETREKDADDDDLFIHTWTWDSIVRLCVVLNYGDETASEVEQRTQSRNRVVSTRTEEQIQARSDLDSTKKTRRDALTEKLIEALAPEGFSLGFLYPRWTWRYLRRNGEDTEINFWLRKFESYEQDRPGTVKG